MLNQRSRSYWVGLALQSGLILLYCVWTLSMPVFPSQDGPLHLYCVEVFRQLLAHHPGIYSQTYFINRYVPPYSLYYYSLIVLGKVTSLPMADKIIVCGYFVILIAGLRSLMRVVSGSANWAPLLFMPVLLSWPLMMGFVNYCIAVGFGCFALAAWCRNGDRPSLRLRLQFLLWLVLILLTHPVPWMFVLSFCFFDLAIRLLRHWTSRRKDSALPQAFCADLFTALVGCLGYFYLLHFRTGLPPHDPIIPIPLRQRTIENAFDYLRTRGLTLYTGTHGAPLLYRLGITLVLACALIAALRYGLPLLRERRWRWPAIWLLFSLLFMLVLPTIPTELNGSYFFAWRLLFLLFLCIIVAGSPAIEHPGPLVAVLLACAVLVTFLNVRLAFQLISPHARAIASLRNAPVVTSSKPGVVMWQAGAWGFEDLTFNPDQWSAATYFREHNLVLYNTSWIYVNIIPIKPRPESLANLEYLYEIRVPQPGGALMETPSEARYLLSRVGFVLAMRINTPPQQNPFAETIGSPVQSPWAAGWTCASTTGWSLCVPPGQQIPALR